MSADIETVLAAADAALDGGRGLRGTGFWRAVDAMRRDPALAERYADRVAAIDRRAFEHGVTLRVPVSSGVLLLGLASASGVALVVLALHVRHLAPEIFLAGTAALIVGTHSLAHFVVGRLLGIRFTHVFLGGPPPPRPGLKTDYGTYLRATRTERAVMHASGAVVTKVVPFALVPFSPRPWLTWLLIAIGVVQILTDVFLSTKTSDWKKVKRELRS